MKIFLFLTLFIICSGNSIGQSEFKVISEKWRQKKYQEVVDLGTRYRATLQGMGIPALDFMILSSICMIHKPKSEPCSEVNLILNDYYKDLPVTDYQLMSKGFKEICSGNGEPDISISEKLPARQFAHVQNGSITTSKFKTYMLLKEGFEKQGLFDHLEYEEIEQIAEAKVIEKDSMKTFTDSLIEKYMRRRVPKKDMAAVKRTVIRFGANSKYFTDENFLIIASNNNAINPRTVAKKLEEVLDFYKNAYGFTPPPDYIVVYLADTYKSVRTAVNRLYLTNITFNPIGYSNFYDNSMIGWLPDGTQVGTLKHELIHLLLRSRFSFIPEWFEEGLAELYEESVFDSARNLIGQWNWRGALLKSAQLDYTLSDLFSNNQLNLSRREFYALHEKYKTELQKASDADRNLHWIYYDHPDDVDRVLDAFIINRFSLYKDALSRYFILYLQERKQLALMYKSLLTRDSTVLDITHYQSLESTVLDVTAKSSLNELEQDFTMWLKESYKSR